jgi:RNA polymerase sigma-70 factor (ECF subfamily)
VDGEVDDQRLTDALEAARRGEEDGFALLWRTLHPALLRYLRVVVGETAEDVASETWLQAARDLSDFAGDATAFRVWLFRVARHRGIDDRRRAARQREDLRETPVDDAALAARDAAAEAADRTELDWALRVITSLPRDQAEVVMLRVVAGLDVAQTAVVLGKRAGAVRVAAMRGLRRLAGHPEVLARRSGAHEPDRPGPGAVFGPEMAGQEGV